MGSNRSRWFIAPALGLAACALPVAGLADTGPVPVNPPAGRDVQVAAAEFGLRRP
jgi:hypothetical protein